MEQSIRPDAWRLMSSRSSVLAEEAAPTGAEAHIAAIQCCSAGKCAMLLSTDDRMSRARIVLERRRTTPADLLSSAIAESWTRCLAAGLDPGHPPPLEMVDGRLLREARERSDKLRGLALAEMENLYHQIAGTNFMIAFAAPDGMLLDAFADSSFDATARATSIRPGTLWAETHCGTNALGTVACTGKPIMVHGAEHFFNRYGDLTCIAAPVFDSDGRLAGVLDASSDCRSRQRHTSALVAMAATQIENGLFRESHRGHLLIAFHSRAEFLHTLSAGLLAVEPDGTLIAANASARFLLHGLPAVRGRQFAELFRTRFATLLDKDDAMSCQRIEDCVGSVYAARLENLGRPRAFAIVVPSPPNFVANDPGVAATVRQVAAAAARGLPILIRGETGTGKEQIARHAHVASKRRGAFVAVNCAALPDSLVEAELFGHADGAFTGARRGGAKGLAVEADGGTLFLDEIGEMKLGLQGVLLRLLDDWTVRPVGGGRPRRVDVQLVAATNVDLQQAIAAGRFRADLYYRIGAVEVIVPPLRTRADFGDIVKDLLAAVAPAQRIGPQAIERLRARTWPGNIRELRNVLIRLTLTNSSGVIDADDVGDPTTSSTSVMPSGTLREANRERIRSIYHETGCNISETGRRLGVSRNTIYRALSSAADGQPTNR
jgi:sigma-54 dependent transcriptional regulator, acetoin dehydrogenase operon transcriptional activator AcoR